MITIKQPLLRFVRERRLRNPGPGSGLISGKPDGRHLFALLLKPVGMAERVLLIQQIGNGCRAGALSPKNETTERLVRELRILGQPLGGAGGIPECPVSDHLFDGGVLEIARGHVGRKIDRVVAVLL